jgi:peptidase E
MKRSAALVVGGSAGAMNLCRQVFNFPERPEQVDGRLESEYFLNGLGFFDKILVPHFNNNREIKYGESELDIFPQFILPLSRGREFLAFDDDSYILLTTKKRALAAEYFGEFYIVKDEIVSALK